MSPLPALLLFALACIGACATNDGDNGPGEPSFADSGVTTPLCSPGAQGCSCSKEGATAACGRVESKSGNYVTCSLGFSTCTGGSWGACVGNHLVTKSMPNVALTSSGVHILASPIACPNVCDPNGCMATRSDPGDIDAAGIVNGADGGISLHDAAIPLDAGCIGLACDIATCSGTLTTTLSGTVYDPAGNNPLYGASVYIPANPFAALPPFGTGASCDTCSGAGALDAVQATQTDAAGNFTLTNVPTLANLPVVVTLGKWRREIVLKTITSCQSNAVAGNCTAPNPADCVFRLPKNHTDGYDPIAKTYTKADLPQIAIVTGASDPFDCLLLKAGIDPHEVGDYMSTKRIHFYKADTGGGNSLDPAYGLNVPGSTMWNDGNPAATMASYDVILLPCEGGAHDKSNGSNTPYQNLINYADSGGRVFTTHFGYSWLEFPAGKNYVPAPDNWSSLANWSPTGAAMTATIDTQDPLTGVVNTSFPKGVVYSQWLQNLGATNTPTQLTIHEGRQDLTTLGKDPQSWMTAHDKVYATAPDYTNLFTFNTPLGAAAAAQCGRVVFSDFHVSASALLSGSNQCISNVDCGFSATCVGSTIGGVGKCNEPCGTSADCPNGSFTCGGATTGACVQAACTKNSDCGTGRLCVGGVCECTSNSDCNGGACGGATCTQVACTSSSQCGAGTCGGGTCPTTVACHSTADCGLGTCGGAGHTGSCAAGATCHTDAQCGTNGTCGAGSGSTAGKCATSAATCHANTDCDSNVCGSGAGGVAGTCASAGGHACHASTDCDNSSCGSGTGSTAGTCAIAAGAACHKAGDCDSNLCGSGTSAVAGKCTTSAGACHTGADCDSGACGSGTGGVAGACAIPGGTTCHKNGDCDSSLCGSGTGGVAGACGTNAQICHAATDCDSAACGGGVCSNGTGHACHASADCDGTNACGLGVKGTCSTGTATACHKTTDCDSGVCGSGAGGSAKGTCTGTCTTNAQCGTGGVCSAAHVCTSSTCSADANCTTTTGVCGGATCTASTANACSADSACTASHVCAGATCGAAPACGADTACTSSRLCGNARCTAKTCGADATCGVSGACSGATCSNPTACAGDAACTSSRSCAGAKCSNLSCGADATCTVSGICGGATCSKPNACAGDSACTSSHSCAGAKCGTPSPATCTSDAACPSSGLCNGAKCSNDACKVDTDCAVAGSTCTGAKCDKSACSGDADCATGQTCTSATCTPPAACSVNADCGAAATAKCSNEKCSANACASSADCGAGSLCGGLCVTPTCTQNSDCPSGICSGGTCGCVSGETCGGSQTCQGASTGTCGRACTQNSDCAPDLCVGGQCGGCSNTSQCHDNGFSPTCGGIPSGNYGHCTSFSTTQFPEACRQGTLSSQEKALEFMFFDLTSCVSPDNAMPPPPAVAVTGFPPATFTVDFTANSCPPQTIPKWREFDWQATIPPGANIVFSAQSGSMASTLLPATPVLLDAATTSTVTGPMMTTYDVALIDVNPKGTGAFNLAMPPVASGDLLRLTITLNPTPDYQQTPSLDHWTVQYDCAAAE